MSASVTTAQLLPSRDLTSWQLVTRDNTASIAGQLNVASGNGFVASLSGSNLTANRSIALPDESGTLCLQGSGNCGFIRLSPPSAQSGSLWLTGGATLAGDLSVRTTTNSANALTIRTASNALVLGVSTTQQRVTLGSADTTATLLVLDTKTNAGDPTGINGAMYYSGDRKKMRCYENGQWENCLSNTKGVPTTKTSAYTADYGDFVIADASGGSFVVTYRPHALARPYLSKGKLRQQLCPGSL